MIVMRSGRSFDVAEDSASHSLFWQGHFAGAWERNNLAIVDDCLFGDTDYVDIGAWIGPFVLWAAARARRVVAVEPDPVALGALHENVERNDLQDQVSVVGAAVAPAQGSTELHRAGEWGDSMSSMVRHGDTVVQVPTVTLEQVVRGIEPGLIKIDIEGGEALVLPANVDLMHDLACPVLLSLHRPWLDAQQNDDLDRALASFDTQTIESGPFPTLLLT